ncbi:MAG: undecaprenyl-diphosphate phosphatase [Bacillaceae bacterium]
MDWLQAFILGCIQGLTEFLPISSTGHLYLGRKVFGLEEAGIFLDTMLHIGTLVAIFIYYRHEFLKIIKKPFSKLTGLLIIGSIPAAVIGILFEDFFDTISKTGVTIGWEFLVTGVIMWWAANQRGGKKGMKDISYSDSFFIGCFQAIAIFPAISRSGATIAGALLRKLDRETAAYYSFLLSTPTILGATLLQGRKLVTGEVVSPISTSALIIGTISAIFFGYIAITWMIAYLKDKSLKVFAYYVWILGAIILFLQAIHVF